MADAPDFAALRRQRNAGIQEIVDAVAKEWGCDPSELGTPFFNPDACYCACPGGGPCEHDWQGWRAFQGGTGGEQVCARCGMGAMAHSIRVAE